MTIATNSTCTEISVTTPDSDLLQNWYTGVTTGVNITWNLNDCSENVVVLPNRYPFNGTISNCVKSSASHIFRLNITGIPVGNVATIAVTGYTFMAAAPIQVSTLVWTLEVTDAVIVSNDPTVTFQITDTSGNTYTVTYTFNHTSGTVNCDSIVLLGNSPTYPSLPCGMEYDPATDTATFNYPFFFGGDCAATTAIPCGVYTISLNTETNCIFVCCEWECLATSVFTLEDLSEKLDVYQALVILNALNAAENTCVNCTQMAQIYAYLKSLVNPVNYGTNTGCGCG
jgi:hypothetical protein